jgi:hypothetical protein
MIARATSLAAAGLALTVLGCGSSRTATVTVTTSATSSTQAVATASPASTTAVPSSTTTSTSSTPTPTPPAPIVHVATFKSPSGNIGCMIIDGTARCDIRQRTWSPPPRPASCPNVVDFGQGLIVAGAGLGRLVCAGDTTLDPAAQVLPYGTDTVAGGFRCASATSGMTCTSTRTGHGFFIAIQGYRVF